MLYTRKRDSILIANYMQAMIFTRLCKSYNMESCIFVSILSTPFLLHNGILARHRHE